jgi:hypothetical protein
LKQLPLFPVVRAGFEVGMYPALMRAIAESERQPDVIVTDIVTLVSGTVKHVITGHDQCNARHDCTP